MTVAELMATLQQLPAHMPVTVAVQDSDRGGSIVGYVSHVALDERSYTGRFDPKTQQGVYETAVCISAAGDT